MEHVEFRLKKTIGFASFFQLSFSLALLGILCWWKTFSPVWYITKKTLESCKQLTFSLLESIFYSGSVALTSESVDEILKCGHSDESYWAVLSCGTVYYAVQIDSNFKPVDEILKCDQSNESYKAVLACRAVYCAIQSGSNFWVRGWNPVVWPFKWKLLSSTFLWCCLLCCTRWF